MRLNKTHLTKMCKILYNTLSGRFCECEESQEIGTCEPECQNGGLCECSNCECQDGYIGPCCECKDCENGFCTEEEKQFCGGIGDQACSGT